MKRLLIILLFLLVSYATQSQTYYSKMFAIENFGTITNNFFANNNTLFIAAACGDSFNGYVRSAFVKCEIQGNDLQYQAFRPQQYSRFVAPSGNGGKMLATDDGYMAVGFTKNFLGVQESMMIVYDENGDTILHKLYPYPYGLHSSAFLKVVEHNHQGFLCVGIPVDEYSAWVVRLDTELYPLWQKIIHVGDLLNYPGSIQSLPGGDILVTGNYFNSVTVQANNHVSSTFMVVLDSLGEVLWHYIDPDPNASAPVFFPTSDGGFISCGSYRYQYTMPYTEDYKPYIVKWNANLEKEWERYDYLDDVPYPHQQTEVTGVFENPDGTFLAYGRYNTGTGMLIKIDAQGNELWYRYYANRNPNGGWYGNEFTDAQTLPDGTIMVLGNVTDYDGFLQPGQQGWLLHLTATGCLPTPDDDCLETAPPPDRYNPPKETSYDSLSVGVAPTLVTDMVHVLVAGLSDTLGLSVQVFNALGQLVLTEQSITQSDTTLPATIWPSGTYAVVLRLRGQVYRVVKVVKL